MGAPTQELHWSKEEGGGGGERGKEEEDEGGSGRSLLGVGAGSATGPHFSCVDNI